MSDCFVGGLDGYGLDFAYNDAVDGLLLGFSLLGSLHDLCRVLLSFVGEVASALSRVEALIDSLCLPHRHVVVRDVLSRCSHSQLVLDALELGILHFLGDCVSRVGWHSLVLVLAVLLLDGGESVVDGAASCDVVDLA